MSATRPVRWRPSRPPWSWSPRTPKPRSCAPPSTAGREAAARVRIVLVSGIYPPDIGGPATHISDLEHEFKERGHDVTVISLVDGRHRRHGVGLRRYPRSWPWALRLIAVAGWLVRRRHYYDVVYATGLHPEAVLG